MIVRIWHGYTTHENADVYETLLKSEIIPGIQQKGITGFKTIQLLRRPLDHETEFTTLMWFDNLESVREFVGDDYEMAYVPQKARNVLSRFDKKVQIQKLRWSVDQNLAT